jgi:hypothetical protein
MKKLSLKAYTKEGLRYIIAIVFIAFMAEVAEITHEKEIIFPEVAALALGLIVLKKTPWQVSRFMLVILMTLCSLFGVLVVRYSPFSLIFNISISFIFTSSCLYFSKTTIIPITSASMLPIILNTTSFIYPISVCILSILISIIQYFMERLSLREPTQRNTTKNKYNFSKRRWFYMLIALIFIAFIPTEKHYLYMIVPPMVVMFIEFSTSSSGFRNRPLQVYVIVVVSAVLGSLFQYIHNKTGLSLFYSECLLFVCIFYAFRLLGKSFAPACAIAVIPTIINQNDLFVYPIEVAIGAFIFLSVSMILFLKCYFWQKPQLFYSILPQYVRNKIIKRPNRNKKQE